MLSVTRATFGNSCTRCSWWARRRSCSSLKYVYTQRSLSTDPTISVRKEMYRLASWLSQTGSQNLKNSLSRQINWPKSEEEWSSWSKRSRSACHHLVKRVTSRRCQGRSLRQNSQLLYLPPQWYRARSEEWPKSSSKATRRTTKLQRSRKTRNRRSSRSKKTPTHRLS